MNDFEIRQALVSICETLKMQAFYFASLHRSYIAFYQSATKAFPKIEEFYNPKEVDFRDFPGSAELLEKVDELLAQLKKV